MMKIVWQELNVPDFQVTLPRPFDESGRVCAYIYPPGG